MKQKLIYQLSSLALIVFFSSSFCACTATSAQTSETVRTLASKQPSEVTDPYPVISDSPSPPKENTQSSVMKYPSDEEFSMIAKQDELPDHIKSNSQHYTKQLSNILKLYYSGLISGVINTDTFTPQKSQDAIPAKNATAEERKNAAYDCTIGGALEYYDLDSTDIQYYEVYNGCLPYFCNDKNGNIYLLEDAEKLQDRWSFDSIWQTTTYNEPLRYIFRFANPDTVEQDALDFMASELSSACRTYYEGIRNLSIQQSDFVQQYTHDQLPSQQTSKEAALGLAKYATVGGAAEYIGKYKQFVPYIQKLGYDSSHQIHPMYDKNHSQLKAFENAEMTMSELFHI